MKPMRMICCMCHKTKSPKGWVREFKPQNAELSHGYCPKCYRKAMKKIAADVLEARSARKRVVAV